MLSEGSPWILGSRRFVEVEPFVRDLAVDPTVAGVRAWIRIHAPLSMAGAVAGPRRAIFLFVFWGDEIIAARGAYSELVQLPGSSPSGGPPPFPGDWRSIQHGCSPRTIYFVQVPARSRGRRKPHFVGWQHTWHETGRGLGILGSSLFANGYRPKGVVQLAQMQVSQYQIGL